MSVETIEVSTSQVSEPTKPRVSSKFTHDVPETIEEAQKRFPAIMQNGTLVDPVYELFKAGYTIALQAPARKELIEQWESINAETRRSLIVVPEKEDGQYTAVLPEANQVALQARMDNWVLGERSPRTRLVRVGSGDIVKDFMASVSTMSEERKAEIAAQVAVLLGTSAPAPAPERPAGRRH